MKYLITYLVAVGCLYVLTETYKSVYGGPSAPIGHILLIATIPAMLRHPFYQWIWCQITGKEYHFED